MYQTQLHVTGVINENNGQEGNTSVSLKRSKMTNISTLSQPRPHFLVAQ